MMVHPDPNTDSDPQGSPGRPHSRPIPCSEREGSDHTWRPVETTCNPREGTRPCAAPGRQPLQRERPHRRVYTARQWSDALAPYRAQNPRRALLELAVTLIPFVALWLAMLASLKIGYWLTLLLAVPTAGFLVRLFMIQHDLGHGSFFKRRRTNDALGRAIGVLTLTPYAYWRRCHAIHHATSGNLDRRGIGDIDMLTVAEYRALSTAGRLRYRFMRHPLTILGLGPAYLFLIRQRLPLGLMRAGWRPWLSVLGTNVSIAVVAGLLVALLGWRDFLAVQAPITLIAGTIGVWLFYVQHQYERTSWARDAAWDSRDAALHGSSHYDLPPVLRWFTASIGLHHIHHLSSRIPSYRLDEALSAHPELASVGRLTLMESFACLPLALWDEDRQRLVAFSDIRC